MIEQAEILCSLAPLNGIYFDIPNLPQYAKKVASLGKSIEFRQENTNELISYVLYYDNGPEMFITMIWTHHEYRGQGFAKRLLRQLIRSSSKDIRLEVHKDNPAITLYKNEGFVVEEKSGDTRVMSLRKKIAIMQPYVFPYIGYFHLIDASCLFVFYDDVNYIKRGWINRNRILLNSRDHMFTIPVSNASQSKLINETSLCIDDKWKDNFNKTLAHSYRKAPFFSSVTDMINSVLSSEHCSISDLAIMSIVSVYEYLGMELTYTRSSTCSPESKGMDKADRLIEISKEQGYKRYVNSPGGASLYSKDYFKSNGIELGFVKSDSVEYKQYANEFVPQLSIIDLLMFNDVKRARELFTKYKVD